MTGVAAGFGGLASPYERAIDGHAAGPLRLLPVCALASWDAPMVLEVDRFMGAADPTDLAALARTRGPVLDVGCGPGRMVRAALCAGRPALGIDVSAAAVRRATATGLPVLHRSLFDPLPREGRWGTVLLLDGNVGIGGDPVRLLQRCAALVAPDGLLLAECHPQTHRDRRFEAIMEDALGRASEPFGWAELGAARLAQLARKAALRPHRQWSSAGRCFVALARR